MAEDASGTIKIPTAVLLVMLGAGGGGASSWVANTMNDPRPDPWTGTDARNQARELRAYVDETVARHEAHGFRMLESVEHDCQHRADNIEALIIRIERRLDRLEKQTN